MLLVTYELGGAGRDDAPFLAAIQVLGPAARPLRTTFLVDTLLNAAQAYAVLEDCLDKDKGDRMLVVEINAANRQGWAPKAVWDFISARET